MKEKEYIRMLYKSTAIILNFPYVDLYGLLQLKNKFFIDFVIIIYSSKIIKLVDNCCKSHRCMQEETSTEIHLHQ